MLLMELAGSLGCCWWGYILHAVWTRTEANPLWSDLHTDERWVISTPSNSVVGANLANSSQLDREESAGKGMRSCRSNVWVGRASANYYLVETVVLPKDQIRCLKFQSSTICPILRLSLSLWNVTSVSTSFISCNPRLSAFHLTNYLTSLF